MMLFRSHLSEINHHMCFRQCAVSCVMLIEIDIQQGYIVMFKMTFNIVHRGCINVQFKIFDLGKSGVLTNSQNSA